MYIYFLCTFFSICGMSWLYSMPHGWFFMLCKDALFLLKRGVVNRRSCSSTWFLWISFLCMFFEKYQTNPTENPLYQQRHNKSRTYIISLILFLSFTIANSLYLLRIFIFKSCFMRLFILSFCLDEGWVNAGRNVARYYAINFATWIPMDYITIVEFF